MNEKSNAIVVRHLNKRYPKERKFFQPTSYFDALKDITFDVAKGESVALLGPNGAGKSSLIKTLCGILTPSSGSVSIAGHVAGTRLANAHLGIILGTRSQLWMHMKIRHCLDLIGDIYAVPKAEKLARISELSQRLEIEQHLDSRARSLSLGERMRCELAATLIHRPKILLADEPTIGLDISAKIRFRKLLRETQLSEGTTIFLTSHDIADVESLAERCILINRGEKIFDGSLTSLKQIGPPNKLVTIVLNQRPEAIERRVGFDVVRHTDNQIVFSVDTTKFSIEQFLQIPLAAFNANILDIRIEDAPLEEVLMKAFEDKIGGKSA